MSEPATFLRTPMFETGDPYRAADYLKAAYGEHGVRLSGSEADFEFSAGLATVGDLAFGVFHHTMRNRADARDGIVAPSIIQQLGPASLRVTSSGRDDTIKHGQSMSVAHRVPYVVDWEASDMQVVMLPPAMLTEVAAPRTDDHVELHIGPALSRAADQQWSQVTHLVRHIVAATNLDDRPLLRDELARTLCTTALACFPNSTLEAAAMDSIQPTPDAVRRAVAYIDDHPDEAIGLVDIAEAARLSPRALQAAFRRHLDTTPLSYLRDVRMAHAHRDLRLAQPGDGQTVATIAHRWGFLHLSRFADAHRDRYGTLPRQTLSH